MLRERIESRTLSLTQPPTWLKDYILGGESTYSGETVTIEGSYKLTAVMAGFTILMEDTASLPLVLYKKLERGKARATDHPLYGLLHDEPNPEHTSMVFREFIVQHLMGWGNFYAQKIWDQRGILRELWPLRPDRMSVFRGTDGQRHYLYRPMIGGQIAFRSEDIWHIPAFGFDGLVGYSRISLARNAIGLAMAAEKYGGKIFQNDARPSVALIHPGKLTDKSMLNLKESWNEAYRGADNAGKAAILEEGMDLKTIGFPPEDAQFLQTRQFQVAEIARIFRIPPHMLGDVEKTTSWGTGIEQQEMGYWTHTLRPWMVRIEQGARKDLMLESEKPIYFFEHLADAILRTNTKERMEAYSQAILNGIMAPNEARERENMNPYDGGDVFRMPLNTAPAGSLRTMEPFLRDAAARIARREIHELQDAEKRWSEKGKSEKFATWLGEFYGENHRNFIRQNLEPFVDSRLIKEDQAGEIAVNYCESHGIQARDGGTANLGQEKMVQDLLDLIKDEV